MIDPRIELLADLDNSQARVVNPPAYIVVCGGPTEGSSGPYDSARKRFLTFLAVKHADLDALHLLPEQIKEWNHYDVYPDLLLFETDLAHLTSAVVLFVESPGSIAELGSFSCIPELARKLLVVIRQDYYDNESFIVLGPLKHLAEKHSSPICVYDWKIDNSDFEPHIPNLVETLIAFVKKARAHETFSVHSVKHRLLLIADLADLFVVIKENEIKEWLERFASSAEFVGGFSPTERVLGLS